MKYFAYGSNMSLKRMEQRGVTISQRVKACLFGYSLEFNKISTRFAGEGVANVVKEKNSVVEGVLYEITEQGIRNLDKYENYPFEYDRRLLDVRLPGGIECKAQVYIAQPSKISNSLKPAKDYLFHLLCAEDLLSANYFSKLSRYKTTR
ncbi:MAG: gamma-glutamylcyclotransferase [Candidatus Dadabacteria bacterium]|nr:gamma-glutamylcyclotransferase [Candidatus Dadabacteria bacterium]NIS07977.1 gamma-glutamylcyclotransferase [Candidatus Dadabacteria bacterium]NIV43098.1 gamma-glutamylcyclotransferase [Candidatus Dadabacteria bacterium]NIX14935.1 gamma-glutamylcyclotransferase [Candidatus Dadabacteria bacterium]NIY21561.1 gamma-glutamylcyclotransferase [Candidatus Dadabacteria bacterium]